MKGAVELAIVVDSSVAASWCLPDEGSDQSDFILDVIAQEGMLVPPLFWYEFRNVLMICERRGRIEHAVTQKALRLVGALPTQVDAKHDEASVLHLSRQRRLTVYDAAYLELALRHGSTLATFDRALRKAAAFEGIHCLADD